MPVGERAFGTSPTGQTVDVVERWAERFLERHASALTNAVADERQKRGATDRAVLRGGERNG